jgi:hypothetical protein
VKRLKVTVFYADGHTAVHEADRLVSEHVQWRVETGDGVLLVPMSGVRSLLLQDAR